MKIFGNRPGNGNTVKCTGSTTYFIKKDEAFRGSIVNNIGCFLHFDKESGLPCCNIIACSHSCEYSIHYTNVGRFSRNKRSYLGKEHDQTYLSKVDRFTSHVRTSQYNYLIFAVI